MELAARDLRCPAMHGYLCRKTFSEDWVRYWHVLHEDSLYCYLTPDDHVTVDVTDLDGYSVTSLEDKFPGQRFVLHLSHKDYIPVYLSASSREEMEEWQAALTSAIKVIPRVNGLHLSQNAEEGEGSGSGSGSGRGHGGEGRAMGIKQKLLAEVLRQTQELERKQAARLASKHKQHSLEDSETSSPPSPSTPPAPSTHTPSGEQICTLTRLRQRRLSTQIKMDTLQRHIQKNQGQQSQKKSRFTFGKKKSVEEPSPPTSHPDLVRQLKTLSDHLSEIDRDLLQNGGVTMTALDHPHHRKSATSSTIITTSSLSSSSSMTSRGRKLISRHSQDLESWTDVGGGGGGRRSGGGGGGGGGGVEGLLSEETSINRSNSLKSSVQKLAHRTFARAGWHRGAGGGGAGKKSLPSQSSSSASSQSRSLERDDSEEKAADGDHPHHHDNNNHHPDVIDLSQRLTRTWPARDVSQESEESGGGGGGGGGEVFLPPPSSFDSGSGVEEEGEEEEEEEEEEERGVGEGEDTSSPLSSPRSARSAGARTGSGSRSSRSRSSSLLRQGQGGGGGGGGGGEREGTVVVAGWSRIPRRQQMVDPDAMANIEAFEEMSRQILGEPT
ncbi:uncharacterized protein LOC143301864 [Babylonia areolata]|uniref:uncharacterized protein LOC143301864 n=1 Tax=Babylonia areolata TaxID=304850 RepID=UPI003FD4CA15